MALSSAAAARLATVKQDIEALKGKIAAVKQTKEDQINWEQYGRQSNVAFDFMTRRQLRGHFGKVYALDWGGGTETNTLLSASQDGKLLLWNAMSEAKKDAISLKSPWVMSCAMEKSEHRFVACGGLDNVCTAFDLRNPAVPAYELVGHDGYLSSCTFMSGGKSMLTGSGDSTCILWDTERGVRKQTFKDHSADVMRYVMQRARLGYVWHTGDASRLSRTPTSICCSVSTHPLDPNVFASGSCDCTVRIWDIRLNTCVRTFTGHVSDINSVEFFPSGNVVGSGSDDSSCRLFDLRSCGPINIFTGESFLPKDTIRGCLCTVLLSFSSMARSEDRIICGITDVAFSKTGRLMFAGYEDKFVIAWETISKNGLVFVLTSILWFEQLCCSIR
jgi:guanine nucleotide-binding protein G(I)/G(S)/G(T) subunit beta-1